MDMSQMHMDTKKSKGVTMPPTTKALTVVDKLKDVLSRPSVDQQFRNALNENKGKFIASLIEVFTGDPRLQQCNPKLIVMEALKAAVLNLPISKSIGQAYLVSYKVKKVMTPVFVIGYKGYIQMAIRSGQYRYINADVIYEGEEVESDRLTGAIRFIGEKTSDKVIGYFAYFKTVNGFEKALVWTKQEMIEYAKRYSPSFEHKSMPWQTEFDKMAIKTMLRQLIGKYGPQSIEMQKAYESDQDALAQEMAAEEAAANANRIPLDTQPKRRGRKPGSKNKKADDPKDDDPDAGGSLADDGLEPPPDLDTGGEDDPPSGGSGPDF